MFKKKTLFGEELKKILLLKKYTSTSAEKGIKDPVLFFTEAASFPRNTDFSFS